MKKLNIILFLTITLLCFKALRTAIATDEVPNQYKRLICTPTQYPYITVEIEFNRLINPLIPFRGFPQMTTKVSVYSKRSNWLYTRENVLIIPQTHPPGPQMRGQSSDALYLVLSPDIQNGIYKKSYTAQMFINDNESNQRIYFRFDDVGNQPGLKCVGEI